MIKNEKRITGKEHDIYTCFVEIPVSASVTYDIKSGIVVIHNWWEFSEKEINRIVEEVHNHFDHE